MSKEETNVNKNEVKNIEFTIKVTKAINVLNEPLQKFILDKQTMAKEVKKIKKFDFGNSLKYIRDNLDQIFQNHPDFDESRRKELDKIVKRCIAIRHKAAHQGTMRDVEPLCRLAALLGSEVDSIVKNVLKGDTDEDMARIRSSDGEKESWKSLKELGNVHVKEGRFNEAIIAYTRAIRLDPNQPVLYSNRSIVELRLKMYKEAREDAEDAIDKSISYPPESRIKYYRLLSEALVGLNLLKEAYLVCQKGLELDSRDEVLMLRNRDLFSILESQPAEKFRLEDLKVKIANVETADSSEIEMLLKRYDILNPPDEDILELDFLEHFNNSAKMQEAIQWFHGIKGKQNNYERAFKIFEDLADKDNAEALYNLGECYGRGLGLLTYDYYKMLDCYRKAASKKPFIRLNYLNQSSLVPNFGVIQAEASLGDAFEKGKGVDVDLDKAFRHYLRAAQLGLAEAQHQLGVLLSEGKGVKQNHKFAREWFKKAADKGMAESMFNYAKMCELGHGGQIDNKDALDYYEKASREGVTHALDSFQRLTKSINDNKNTKRFEETLKTAEYKKDPNALYLMGKSYFNGNSGYEKNFNLAYKYLKEAADLDHLEAIYLLSELLLEKLKRSEEGFQYCLKASERGNLAATRQLIDLYTYGHGCERDEAKARRISNRLSSIYDSNKEIILEYIFNKELKKISDSIGNLNNLGNLGKELCEFEKKHNLDQNGLNLMDRIKRWAKFKLKDENNVISEMFENFLNICETADVHRSNVSLCELMPKLVGSAKNGSITATRIINGIYNGYEAIELISKNSEYEKSIKLLKESFIECDEVYDLFIRQFRGEINKAVENCDPNNRDVMYIKSLLLDTQGAVLFLERCLQVYPNEAIFYQRLSCLYNYVEDYGKSIELISRALELDYNPRWFYYKAKSLILKLQLQFYLNSKDINEDINECFKWYVKYLESNPRDDQKVPEVYFSLAFLYSLKEDKENARVYLYKAFVAEKNRLECFEQVGDNYGPKLFAKVYLMSSIDKCGQCMKSNPKFKCPCLLDAYCDKKCQKAHWSIHKIVCKRRNRY